MKLLLLSLMVVGSSCAMQKKAAPMVKSKGKFSLTALQQKAVAAKQDAIKKASKPYTEEDRPWYLRTVEEKANQYGHSAAKYKVEAEEEVATPSRDHALHEGIDND